MSDVVIAVGLMLGFLVFCFAFVAGGTYEYYRAGGTKDLQRDVRIALRAHDDMLALLSQPPISKASRGTLPVSVTVERSPLTLIKGDAS